MICWPYGRLQKNHQHLSTPTNSSEEMPCVCEVGTCGKTRWTAFKTLVGCLEGVVLPSDIGIVINYYKDPYRPTSIMGWYKGCEHCPGGLIEVVSKVIKVFV